MMNNTRKKEIKHDDAISLAESVLQSHDIELGSQLKLEMYRTLSELTNDGCAMVLLDSVEIDTHIGKQIIQVSFDLGAEQARLCIWVTHADFSEFDIIQRLSDRSLVMIKSSSVPCLRYAYDFKEDRGVAIKIEMDIFDNINNFTIGYDR